MANYTLLRDELINDPLARGYPGMTDQLAADAVSAEDRDLWNPLSSAEIFEALDSTEFQALSADEVVRVDRILGLGNDISTSPGSQARGELVTLFGGGSTTIASLQAIAKVLISRAQEVGFGRDASANDVARARA